MRLKRDFLDRLYAFSLYGSPLANRSPRTTMERLRCEALRYRFSARKQAWQRVLLWTFCTISYPIAVAVEASRNLRFLKSTRPKAGWSTWRRMYSMAIRWNIPPLEYVTYDLEDPAKRALAPQYLYWMDGPALLYLNSLREADTQDVQDKARFASICEAHGLPHVRSLGVFRRGETPPGLDVIVGEELWVKPISLSGRRGAELWIRHPEGYQSKGGRLVTREALHAELSGGDFLLQARLKNHEALREMTPDGEALVLRIVTGLGLDGQVELLMNSFGLPGGTTWTPSGFALFSLHWEDGRMWKRMNLPGSNVTEVDGADAPLPFFAEAIDLCCRAHKIGFQKFVTLGWDVVFTPDGPSLLETNVEWGALLGQMLSVPLGHTPMPRLVEQEWHAQKGRQEG